MDKTREVLALMEVRVFWVFNSNSSLISHLLQGLPIDQPRSQLSCPFHLPVLFTAILWGLMCFKYPQGKLSFPLQAQVHSWAAGSIHQFFPQPALFSNIFFVNIYWLLSLSRRSKGMWGSQSWMFLLNTCIQPVLRFLTYSLIYPLLSCRSEMLWWQLALQEWAWQP